MSANEFQLVQDAIAGHRDADEQALGSLAVLEERLERIQALGGKFAEVGFSWDVRMLRRNKSLTAVS